MATNLENKLNTILNEKREKILPQNIKKGVTVFDITGELEILDTSDATAVSRDIVQEKTAYVNGEKIQGTMPNNGILSYEPTEEEQNIPTGYTSGGTIRAVDITKLSEYEACLTLANSIETTEIYTDTTATADDIKKGKIAYSNGERLVGTYEIAGEEITITPSNVEQIEEGLFNKVTVTGDENLISENIKQGTEIFGVTGTMEAAWDSSQIRQCYYMFNGNITMTEAPLFNTENVTNMNYMFNNCSNLIKVPKYNTKNITTMQHMFENCSNLEEVAELDTSKVTNMYYMFMKCKKIVNVPLLNTENVTNMSGMFSNCSSLIEVPSFNTKNATNMTGMFDTCSLLKTIPQFNVEKVINMQNIFYACSKLENLGGFLNLGKSFTSKANNNASYALKLSFSTLITHESLMNVINNLYDLNLTYDVANGGTLYTQSLVLGSTNLAKLTAEEIAVATNKGWTIS